MTKICAVHKRTAHISFLKQAVLLCHILLLYGARRIEGVGLQVKKKSPSQLFFFPQNWYNV